MGSDYGISESKFNSIIINIFREVMVVSDSKITIRTHLN